MTNKNTITDKIQSNTIWRISVETKYGTDIILIRQDEEPTPEELKAIEGRFKLDYDIEDVSAEHAGSIDFDSIPLGVEGYLAGGYS